MIIRPSVDTVSLIDNNNDDAAMESDNLDGNDTQQWPLYKRHCKTYGFGVEIQKNYSISNESEEEDAGEDITTSSSREGPTSSSYLIGKNVNGKCVRLHCVSETLIIRPYSKKRRKSSKGKLRDELRNGDVIRTLEGQPNPRYQTLYEMMSRNEKLVLEVSTGPIDDGSEIEGSNNKKTDASVAVGGGGATKSGGSRSGRDSGRGASSNAQSGGGGGRGGANTASDGKTKNCNVGVSNSTVTTGKSSEIGETASLPTSIRNASETNQCPPSQQQDQELINNTDDVCGEHPPLLVASNTNDCDDNDETEEDNERDDHVLVTFTSGKEEWVHKSKLRSAASGSQPPHPAEGSTNGNAKDEEELALFKMIEEQATAPSPAEGSTDGNAEEEKEEDDSSSSSTSSSSSSSSCSSSSSSSSSDSSANDMGGDEKESSTASTSAQQIRRPPPVITTCSSTSTTTKPTRVDTSAQAGSSASAFNRGRGIGTESAPPSTARLFPDPSDLVKALTRWIPPRAANGKKGIEFYDPIRCKNSQSCKDNPFLQYENEKKSVRTALTFRDSDEVMSTFVPCLLDEGLCKL